MTNQNFSGFFDDDNSNKEGSGDKPGNSLSGFFDAPKKAAPAKKSGGRYLTEERFRQLAREEGAEHILPTALSIFVQESGGGRTTATSIDGARSVMQVMPDTFKRMAKPGENIDNVEDNARAGLRYLKHISKYANTTDPARLAVGYFSGEGNVNKDPNGTPWRQDRKDENGKTVSGYAADVVRRMGGKTQGAAAPQQAQRKVMPLSQAPKWADIVAKPEYAKLTPEQKLETKQAYFDHFVAPHAGAQAAALRSEFLANTKNDEPSLFTRAKNTAGEIGGAVKNLIDHGTPGPASVLSGRTMPEPEVTANTSFAPVKPEVRAQFNAAWDAATPEARAKMQAAPGWQGQLARDRAGKDAIIDTRQDMTGGGVLNPVQQHSPLDTRAEARTAFISQRGEDPAFAHRAAVEGAARGVPLGLEVDAVQKQYGTAQPSTFDFETANRFAPSAESNGFNNPIARSMAKGVSVLSKAVYGINEFVADTVGADEYAAWARGKADGLRGFEQAIGERGTYLERNLEGAINSITQQIPAMAMGIATGGTAAIPLGAMGVQSFGQEYSDGRAAGQSVGDAVQRAAAFAALEVLGEKFGLGDQIAAIKGAIKGMPSDQIMGFVMRAFAKEVPGEILTTSGQFAIDKIPGGVGLNPNAGVGDYFKQVADTIVQTVMQTGVMAGGTTGLSAAVRYARNANKSDLSGLQPAAPALGDIGQPQPPQEPPAAPPAAPAPEEAAAPAAPAPVDPIAQPDAVVESADAVVADLAQQAGVPLETVLPNRTPRRTAGEDALLKMIEARRRQLTEKRDGTLETTFTDGGAQDSEKPGRALSPVEETELAAIEAKDMGTLRRMYGLDRQQAPEQMQAPEQAPLAPEQPAPTLADRSTEELEQQRRNAHAPEVRNAISQELQRRREAAKEQDATQPEQVPAQDQASEGAQGQAPAEVEQSAHEAATSPHNDLPEPTQAQKEAGNYKKGHVKFDGLDLAIENPAGSSRSGTDSDGEAWAVDMSAHYGYMKRTEGADGDQVDVYLAPEPVSGAPVFVVDQYNADGTFDEHKAVVGVQTQAQAEAIYDAHFSDGTGPQRRKGVAAMSVDDFKAWAASDAAKKPAAPQPAAENPKTEKESKERKTVAASKEDVEHLFGVDKKREKALDRIKRGTAYFGSEKKAKEFITQNGLKDTHEVKQSEAGTRWDVVAKQGQEGGKQDATVKLANAIPPGATKAATPDDAPESSSQLIQDFIDGKRDTPPTGEEVEAEQKASSKEPGEAKANQGTVKVPQAVSDALESQLRKQKGRITRLRNEANKAESLEDKKAAQLKVTAAETTLRKMRTGIFGAEDAAIKAIETGSTDSFDEFASLFPDAAEEVAKLVALAGGRGTLEKRQVSKPMREATHEDDIGSMFDEVLAEEVAKDKAAEKPKTEKAAKELREHEPMFSQATKLMEEQKAATGNPKAEAAVRRKVRPLVDPAQSAAEPPKTEREAKAQRTAAEAATSAAKNTAAALDAAINGLGELFGGSGKLNSGLAFDEQTYAKAKPLFEQAIAHMGEAGKDMKEAMRAVVRMVLDKFGPETANNMKPYVVRFIKDVAGQAGQEDNANTAPTQGERNESQVPDGAADQSAPDQSAAEVRADEGSGDAGPVPAKPAGADAGSDYSTRTPRSMMERAQRNMMHFFGNSKKLRTFGAYHKSLSTQYHKALKDKHFGKVFNLINAMQNHVSMAAIRPAELAPGVLPRVDDVRSAVRGMRGKGRVQMEKVSRAIFEGTLAGGGDQVMMGTVWSDDQLRERFDLDDAGIGLYRQARSAINTSIDELAAAEAYALAQNIVPKSVRENVIDNPQTAWNILRDEIQEQIDLLKKAMEVAVEGDDTERIASLFETLSYYEDTLAKVNDVFGLALDLKEAGYAPLMRFGQYTVTVFQIDPETGQTMRDDDGKAIVEYFGKFMTQAEAIAKQKAMEAEYPEEGGYRVTSGVESKTAHEMYAGVTPETVAMFGEMVGADEVTHRYYQNALTERSALKRRLQRKGTDGYNEELSRVLSNFITSNARLAAQRYYLRDVNNAIKYIPSEKGDVKDEASDLKKFILDPSDAAAPVSTIMFSWYLGGSIAAAMVNMTQPLMMTFPYLSQFGGGQAAAEITKAIPYAMGKREIADRDLRDALKRASQEGIVDAQEIFHLYSMGAQSTSAALASALSRIPGAGKLVKEGGARARAGLDAFLTLWGSMFSLAERFNRKLTFIAAWNMAVANGTRDPYAFAVRAVNETQGIYNKVNRPNWARRAVGRTILTFKQFSIMYLEMMTRMWKHGGPEGKRATMMMLAILMLVSGEEGLPFVDDLDDLIDTIGQRLFGSDTNMKRFKRSAAHELLGKEMGDLLLYGISSKLPLDFSGRLGLGNLIPGTGMLKPSDTTQRTREVAEVFGPAAGVVAQVGDAFDAMEDNGVLGGAKAMAPKAVRDLAAGLEMASKGYSTDMMGRKVTDTTLLDAGLKSIGFNPTRVANVHRKSMPVQQDVGLQKKREAAIVDAWARAIIDGDDAKVNEAIAKLETWNTRNPNTPIVIKGTQIRGRVQTLLMEKEGRVLRTTPKEMRGLVADTLEDAE